MKRLLQLGFLLGLGGTIAAAWFTPWFEYTRYRSATSVVTNGGRVEQFMVRLPADRVESSPGAEDPGPGIAMQHFKLRDTDGNVIGLVARHELATTTGVETAWLVTIPSRGSIALAASGSAPGFVESAVAANGVLPGQSVDQPLSIDFEAAAESVTATGEFSGIDFEMVETWVVSGVDDDGQLRGTLLLNTVGRRAST
jgi:hypothetical protein